MEVISESRKRKLSRHAARLVKEHGAEVAANILVSLVSGAAAMLLQRRKAAAVQATPDGEKRKKDKKVKKRKGKHGKRHKKSHDP